MGEWLLLLLLLILRLLLLLTWIFVGVLTGTDSLVLRLSTMVGLSIPREAKVVVVGERTEVDGSTRIFSGLNR